MTTIRIAPSILSADFANMGEAVQKAEQGGADFIHLDVMDGNFVPVITFGHHMCAAVKKHTKLPIDAHLMVREPARYIQLFAEAGAEYFTFHAEAETHIHRTIQAVKAAGMKAGVSLNPATPLSAIECVLSECDMVLLMTVNPGYGGQAFIPEVLPKIAQLAQMIKQTGKDILLESGPDVYELLDLGLGRCRLCVAAPAGWSEDTSRPLRVAGKFANIAKRYYAAGNREIEFIELHGSIELAPLIGLADVIVDLVESGATLRDNNLFIVAEIMPISARLIVNKAAYKFKNERIGAITAALAAAAAP